MGRVWPITLATACATFALAVGGCGDGEQRDANGANGGTSGRALMGEGGAHHGGSGGDAGTGELAGDGAVATGGVNDGSGGATSGGSGSRARGGSGGGAANHSGGSGAVGAHTAGGTGGADTTGGTSAEAGDTGLAGTGTGGTPRLEQLDVCERQTTSPSVLGWDASRDFEHAVNFDCRIAWVRLLYLDDDKRVEFLNQLIAFSTDVWGCIGSSPPQSFDLIWTPTPLSAADVALLIDDYVEVVKGPLSLTPGEIEDLRALLGRLAEPLLMDPDPGDFSQPTCDETGAAGAAGAGGHAGAG